MEKSNPMRARQSSAENRVRHANKKPRRRPSRKITVSRHVSPRRSPESETQKMQRMSGGDRGPSRNGAAGVKKHPARTSLSVPKFRYPKTDFEQAVQRYVDLFELAPIGYVTFDRFGRIEEINFAAVCLVGRSHKQLIGSTFAICVAKEDTQHFLDHLLECRSSRTPVVTELRLQRPDGEKLVVQLSSAPTFALMKDGATLYQTAIVDLTQQKRTEQSLTETAREAHALFEFVRRLHGAKRSRAIHSAALDAILSALRCDRASILLFDPSGVMRFVDSRGLSARYRKAVEGHSPWDAAAKNPQPVCIGDVDLADIPKQLKSTIKAEGIHAAAFIPLLAGEKLIGKFMTYYNSPHIFTDVELQLATTVATQLAQAIRQKRDEESLRESEARLRATVEQATAGMARCDANGQIVFVNRKLCEMLGYTKSELVGKTFDDVSHPDDVQEDMRRFRRMIRHGAPFETEKRYLCKNGSILWADVSASAVPGSGDKTESAVAVIVDITARKKAEAALQQSNERLEQLVQQRTSDLRRANAELKSEIERRRGLEGEILSVSDREQQRLGQELHDGLCQHLTAVAFMARSVAMRLKNHRVIEAGDIEKIANLVNAAAVDTRNLSTALHRADVDAAGFITALDDLVDREIWKMPCRLEVKPSFRIEDDGAAAHLYRIAREAVINANKHAQARKIIVKLEHSREGMVLRVIDDGVGFSDGSGLKPGLGLHIMSYRAQLLGGRLEIDSPKEGGTRVSCYLPDDAIGADTADRKRIAGDAIQRTPERPRQTRRI
jgi:PAS domain S-box-containing protein